MPVHFSFLSVTDTLGQKAVGANSRKLRMAGAGRPARSVLCRLSLTLQGFLGSGQFLLLLNQLHPELSG